MADSPRLVFEHHYIDTELGGRSYGQTALADLDRDGRPEVVTMSDKNNIRWYAIPSDPRQPWVKHDIGPPVHAGLSLGDIDGDGDLDVFSCEMEGVPGVNPPRWYIWENLDGKGGTWREHVILDANLGGHEAVVGDNVLPRALTSRPILTMRSLVVSLLAMVPAASPQAGPGQIPKWRVE